MGDYFTSALDTDMTWTGRFFNFEILDMYEVGITKFRSMAEISKTAKPTLGIHARRKNYQLHTPTIRALSQFHINTHSHIDTHTHSRAHGRSHTFTKTPARTLLFKFHTQASLLFFFFSWPQVTNLACCFTERHLIKIRNFKSSRVCWSVRHWPCVKF